MHEPCLSLKNGLVQIYSTFHVTAVWSQATSYMFWLNTLRCFRCSPLKRFPSSYISGPFLLHWLMFACVLLLWSPDENTQVSWVLIPPGRSLPLTQRLYFFSCALRGSRRLWLSLQVVSNCGTDGQLTPGLFHTGFCWTPHPLLNLCRY